MKVMLNLDKELKEIEKLGDVINGAMDKIQKNISSLDNTNRILLMSNINDIKQALKGKKDINEVVKNIKDNANSI